MSTSPEPSSARASLSRVFGTKRRSRIIKPDLDGLFTLDGDARKASRDEEKKIDDLSDMLTTMGLAIPTRSRLEYAIRSPSTGGDVNKAAQMIVLYKDSVDGILTEFNPDVAMQGAVNRDKVTCYLDSLLFALFCKPDVFEGMVYHTFENDARRRLVVIIRLWINMLRTGRLITTDITQQLQEALASCGWAEAAQLRQQDVSEAFSFITDQLELPLLTLKTDLYHAGKEDANDDHKFITERLLEVAIPENTNGEPVTLERCLEDYFNNRVEVRRELARRNTCQKSPVDAAVDASGNAPDDDADSIDKPPGAIHVEIAEVDPTCESPVDTVKNMIQETVKEIPPPVSNPPTPTKVKPPFLRDRALSIFSERKVLVQGTDPADSATNGTVPKTTKKKEVTMPAWQFLNLIPWYAYENSPQKTDKTQVASHFARSRPMLGICLKRYQMFYDGTSKPLDTRVEIPLEMSSPRFAISDNPNKTQDLASDKFRLSLQSLVCHRGANINSGHYISIVRIPPRPASRDSGCDLETETSSSEEAQEDTWLKMDDLGTERVTKVKIQDILQHERPYLLFYRVEAIGDMEALDELPPYEGGGTLTNVDEKLWHLSSDEGRGSLEVEGVSRRESVVLQSTAPSRNSMSSNRGDYVSSEPHTPGDEPSLPILEDSAESSRNNSKSIRGRDPRLSSDSASLMSRITSRLSRDRLPQPDIQVSEVKDSAAAATATAAGVNPDVGRDGNQDGSRTSEEASRDRLSGLRKDRDSGSKERTKESSKDRMSKLIGRGGSIRRKRKTKRGGSSEAEQTCVVQ